MTLRRAFVLLSTCLALPACDDGFEGVAGSSGSTGGESSTTADTSPTGVSVTITASASATVSATETTTSASATTSSDSSGGGESTTDGSASSSGGSNSSGGEESSSGTTGTTGGVTIYDVQDGTVAEGTMVEIEGVVITALREGVGVVLQEIDGGEFSAVYVDTADVDVATFSVGDVVDVSGLSAEDNPGSSGLEGLTQILIGESGSMTATGDTMELTPEGVDFAVLADPDTAEPWETVLVTTTGSFTATNAGDFFGQFGEFAAVDGEQQLVVDNFLYMIFDEDNAADFPGFAEGATFTELTGVLNYSFGDFKVAPRDASELGGYVAPAG